MNDKLIVIITECLFILAHFFIWRLNVVVFKKQTFHPAILYSFVWFISVLGHFITRYTVLPDLNPLSLDVHLMFLAGAICFSGGALLQDVYSSGDLIKKTDFPNSPLSKFELNKYLCLCCTIIITIGLPFFIRACYEVFLQSELDDFFKGLKTELCYGDTDIGPTKYLITLSFITFGLNCILFFNSTKKKFSRTLLIISLIVTLIYIVFSTGRTYFIILVSLYLGINFFYGKKFSFTKIILTLVSFMLLFSVMGIYMYSKGGNAENTTKENTNSAIQEMAVYAFTPLNACGLWVDNDKPDDTGDRTLRTVKKVLKQTNILPNAVILPLIEENVFVPYMTNVYTVYGPYYRDFGWVYTLYIITIFGFLHTYLFNKLKIKKSINLSIYYALLLFPLLMSFFEDQYLSLFSMWIQIIVIVELFCFVNKVFNRYTNEGENQVIYQR